MKNLIQIYNVQHTTDTSNSRTFPTLPFSKDNLKFIGKVNFHSHYDENDLHPFFYKTLSKPIPQWFLAVETSMLQFHLIDHAKLQRQFFLKSIDQNPIMTVNLFHWVLSY